MLGKHNIEARKMGNTSDEINKGLTSHTYYIKICVYNNIPSGSTNSMI